MKRLLQFAASFVIALPFVSFLPLYVRQTMTRSQTSGNAGDITSYGWKLSTLYGYLWDYDYFRPEENFSLWLVVNLVLAGVYASVIALGIVSLLVYLNRRKTNSNHFSNQL